MSTVDVSSLNTQFGITDQVTFVEGQGGLVTIEIDHPECSASIVLQGAHLTHWKPSGQRDVIWLSPAANFAPNKAIRGGIPICWPWFGPHPTETHFPSHGIARTGRWDVITTKAMADKIHLSLRFTDETDKNPLWPYATTLEIDFTLGRVLDIELVTSNSDREAIHIGQALHTYFNISDIDTVSVHGLEDGFYLDKTDYDKRKQQLGLVKIGAETDRIYTDTGADCVISDPGFQRQICIEKQGSQSTIVWNPGAEKSAQMSDMEELDYKRMLCIESANAAGDMRTIQPGATHQLNVRYSVSPLDDLPPKLRTLG